MREADALLRPTIHEALNAWRAAERRWEAMPPDDPAYRAASIAVIAAWLTYHAPTELADPGSFVLVADEEHRFVAVSDGVRKTLGYEPTDLLGKRIEEIAPPDLAARTPAQWQQFLADGRQDGEFRLRRIRWTRSPVALPGAGALSDRGLPPVPPPARSGAGILTATSLHESGD